MPIFVRETLLNAPVERVWEFHMRDGALQWLTPPGSGVRIVKPARVEEGSVVELSVQMKPLPIRLKWLSRHQDIHPPRQFVDVAIQSPFARWEHRHLFLDEHGRCRMRDEVHYDAPLGALGNLVSGPVIRHMLDAQFTWRHARLVDEFGAG